jgi:hypothetical protein
MTERIAEGAKIRRQSAVTVINALRSRRGDRSTLALRRGTPRHSEAATGKRALAPCAETKPGLRKDVRATRALIVILIAQMFCGVLAQGQSSNMTGRWNVEINFADGNKRSLRFDAQADGKGTFLLLDPMLSRWGTAKPSEAKWTPADQNSVTFSGAVEFPLGNVGRDPGTLMFKGKFETADSITGEVEFAPLVGERPSKHGTFKATRDNSAH